MHSFDVNQQSSVADDALGGNLWIIHNSSPLMSKVTTSTDIEHFALPPNRPTAFVPFNPGVLHTDSRAKYAVAFLKMSRSIFTFASSALSRVNSICSALTGLAPASANWPFAACRTQFSLMSEWASPELWLSPRMIDHPQPIAPLLICIPVCTMLS
jgi:hypothetical protein